MEECKMKKLARILALTLSLAMALFLVACGNTAAPAEEEAAEETEAAETEETHAVCLCLLLRKRIQFRQSLPL